MNDIQQKIREQMEQNGLWFAAKPILIGGMAMEYYGMRKSGADIDLVITNEDYQRLAAAHPEERKDLYGDLGLVLGPFEIWRSIAHLDYAFFRKDAIEEENVFVLSIDRLLWTRVCAMGVEKYRKDLELLKEYYYRHYTNADYHAEALTHEKDYAKHNGAVFGGAYEE